MSTMLDQTAITNLLPSAYMQSAREPDAPIETKTAPSRRTLRGLDWLNFFLADVQTGVGPFLAIYLAGYGWNEQRVGIALTVGGIAGILIQTPAGALVDHLRSKRALISAGIVALALGALGIVGHRLFDLPQGRNQAFNSAGNVIAGSIVHSFGSNAGFLFLGAVAAAAFGILCFFMPETRDKRFLNPTP